MKVIDPGFTYEVTTYEGKTETIRFAKIKKSALAEGHAVVDQDGIDTEQLFRIVLDRMKHTVSRPGCPIHVVIAYCHMENAFVNMTTPFAIGAPEKPTFPQENPAKGGLITPEPAPQINPEV